MRWPWNTSGSQVDWHRLAGLRRPDSAHRIKRVRPPPGAQQASAGSGRGAGGRCDGDRVEIFYGVNARIWANPVSCSHITFFVGCSLLPPNRKSTGIRTIRTTSTLRGANQSSRTETHTPNPLLPLDLHYSIRNVHPGDQGAHGPGTSRAPWITDVAARQTQAPRHPHVLHCPSPGDGQQCPMTWRFALAASRMACPRMAKRTGKNCGGRSRSCLGAPLGADISGLFGCASPQLWFPLPKPCWRIGAGFAAQRGQHLEFRARQDDDGIMPHQEDAARQLTGSAAWAAGEGVPDCGSAAGHHVRSEEFRLRGTRRPRTCSRCPLPWGPDLQAFPNGQPPVPGRCRAPESRYPDRR